MLDRLLLVRHGEVLNPDHVVYADLPGFGLSPLGAEQAAEAADHIAQVDVDLLLTSPIRRAVETSLPISASLGIPVATDRRLYEWRLGVRWAPTRWEDLPAVFPGELEAYLTHVHDLPFAPESISDVADRFVSAVLDAGTGIPGGTAVMVSHQDPVQAARLRLTGRPMSDLPNGKPAHGSVTDLVRVDGHWTEASVWHPSSSGAAFPPAAVPRP